MENGQSVARRACEARALRARKTLPPRFNDFFTDFEKKTDCFAVLDFLRLLIQSREGQYSDNSFQGHPMSIFGKYLFGRRKIVMGKKKNRRKDSNEQSTIQAKK